LLKQNTMKVTLKNVKVNLTFSQETIMFMGDLYIDNKKVGYCRNEGHGGCTTYNGYSLSDNKIIEECERYFSSLPPTEFDLEGKKIEIPQSLEGEIDRIIEEMSNELERKKFEKKKQKEMLTKLLFSKDDPNQYLSVGWKNKFTIQQMLDDPLTKKNLIEVVKKYKKDGYVLLNTNVPKELVS
jgi:hypothetical protein